MRLPLRALAAAAVVTALVVPTTAGPALAAEPPTTPTSSAAPASSVVNAAVGTAPLPDLGTKAWVLADLDSGQILAMHNPDRPVHPASTLKLLTALTVAPRLSPDQPYRAVKADEDAEGNRVVMYAGMKYKVSDLLHAALLPSANDAAEALARANGGMAVTLEQMNAEAARLGASHTVAKTPSGLEEDGQQTTAYDMAVIGRAAFANPEIVRYLGLKEVDFPGKSEDGKRIRYAIWNHNQMLQHNYPGTIGGKSGYTSRAGRTYVGAVERDGRRLLVAMMGIAGNTYRTPERLFTWAFANLDRLTPVGQLAEPSGPAPTFDRTIRPLTEQGKPATTTPTRAKRSSDAPTSTEGVSSWGFPGLPSPSLPPLPPPLTLLTWAMLVIVALRTRVYWIAHRNRTAWIELDVWARRQARSARRAAPRGGLPTDEPLAQGAGPDADPAPADRLRPDAAEAQGAPAPATR